MTNIYLIENCKNGKRYVGQTSKMLVQRLAVHLAHARRKVNRYLYDAINHYGPESFAISLLEETAPELADDREKYWIATLGTLAPLGYNMTPGGGGGYTLKHWTEDQRAALYKQQGESRKGHTVSPETRELIASKHRGKSLSEETREKISSTCVRKGIQPPEHTKWKKVKWGLRRAFPIQRGLAAAYRKLG